jgi:hypothetical protein
MNGNGTTQMSAPCPVCKGTGLALNTVSGDYVKCPYCGGRGFVPRKFNRQHFDYCFPTALIQAAGTPVSVPLQLDDDADFEQTGWSFSDLLGTGSFLEYTIYVVCQSSGQRLMNDSTIATTGGNSQAIGIAREAFANFVTSAGNAINPFPLVQPYVWKKNSVLLATFTPRATLGSQISVQLTMKGYKLYPLGNRTKAAA